MMLCIMLYLYSPGCSRRGEGREAMPAGATQAWGEGEGFLVWDMGLV